MTSSIPFLPKLSRLRGWLILGGAIIHSCFVFNLVAASDSGVTLSAPFFTNDQIHLMLTGKTGLVYVVERSGDFQTWTPVATNYFSSPVTQEIVMNTAGETGFYRTSRRLQPLFFAALSAVGTIDLKGNGISSDSYDSADPNYSTNGVYTSLRRKAGGDIVTDSLVFNVGNANVAGHVRTAPGGTVTFTKNCSVGDVFWVSANTQGIEPGWATDDMNVVFKDVVLPNVSWTDASGDGTGGSGTAPDGNLYDHIFTSPFDTAATPGNYTITDNGNIYVGTNVAVQLNISVAGSFSPNKIFVAGVSANEAGKLVAYLNGPSSLALSPDMQTQSGKPANLMFFGMPGCTNITFTATGDWTGALYAPEANLNLNGGGLTNVGFCGASVTGTISANGLYQIHFDEDLMRSGPFR
jgi:hypothetical protein